MGSLGDDAASGFDEVTILVTGFGKFTEQYPDNPAWLIASSLPTTIEPTPSHPTRIHLRIHPEAIHVSYANVLELVPKLLEPTADTPTPDMVLHLGLAGRRDWFAIETGAHRAGYGKKQDVSGGVYEDEKGEVRWPAYPKALDTGFDVQDVLVRWRAGVKGSGVAKVRDADARVSEDAGDYMCGFIYWNSLAWFYEKLGKDADLPVGFCHVPPLPDEEDVEMGRLVTVELIRAIALSNRMKKTGGRKARGSRPMQRAQVADAN